MTFGQQRIRTLNQVTEMFYFLRLALAFIGLAVCLALPFYAEETLADDEAGWNYDKNGWEWSNPETGSYLWAGLRFQLRYSNRVDDPLIPDDLRKEGDEDFNINRARYKIGAGIGEHFTAYHEYDLRNGRLLDFRGTWTPSDLFQLRVGQWKAEFNRERIDSSGKQQFAERSIATYWFTVDRQSGVMASGRIGNGSPVDSSWWLGVLRGNGINSKGDGGRPMVVGRYQWNFTRNVLPFSQSALKRYEEPHGSIAAAFMTNDSPYTRFSSSGGGSLPGFEKGDSNQYRLSQFLLEYAWQKQGWSLQAEAHHKKVEDRQTGKQAKLVGGYFQAGVFPAAFRAGWSESLELATRIGFVDPGKAGSSNNSEFTLAINWFFNGHRNKLTSDVSRLMIEDLEAEDTVTDWRFRIQWEISL